MPVTDNADASGAFGDPVQVTVNNVAPSFDAGPDENLPLASAGSFSRTIGFTDPGTLDVHTVTVDFGDGNGDTFTLPVGDRSFTINHTFTDEGTFTVSVTVEDDNLGSSTETFEVTVELNTPPVADAGGPYVITVGGSLALDASGSTDADGDDLTFTWDLTDNGNFTDAAGESPTLTWEALVAMGIDGPGEFPVAVRVDDGRDTDVAFATLTIQKATPTLTLVWAGGTYDGSAFAADGSVTGFDGGDLGTPTFTYFVGADTSGQQLASAPVDAGTYTVLAGFAGDSHHTAASATATITIDPASLTVTADNQTRTYDGSVFEGFTVSYSGFIAGDDAGVLDGTLAFGGPAVGAVNAGSYQITVGGLASNNYAITFQPGTLTIEKAHAVIVVNGTVVTFDGQAHGAAGRATGAAGEDLTRLLSLGAQFINVPGGTAHWFFAGDGNHHPAAGSVPIVVETALGASGRATDTETSPSDAPALSVQDAQSQLLTLLLLNGWEAPESGLVGSDRFSLWSLIEEHSTERDVTLDPYDLPAETEDDDGTTLSLLLAEPMPLDSWSGFLGRLSSFLQPGSEQSDEAGADRLAALVRLLSQWFDETGLPEVPPLPPEPDDDGPSTGAAEEADHESDAEGVPALEAVHGD